MAYTIKTLSNLSGVTVRTLHFYEEQGLLKPAYYGSNGYRYYEEKELLQLQQILFFKKLGFTLKQIQKILGRSDFDQLAALHSHRKFIKQEWERLENLIKTIDKTINHLQGKKKMKDQEIFDGFTLGLAKSAKKSESYFAAEALVLASIKNFTTEKRKQSYYKDITKKAHIIFKEIVDCIENGCNPHSKEIQNIIKRHHALTEDFHDATKSVYKALAQLYLEHPTYRKQLDPFHPRLAGFLAQGMETFADRNL